jgi:fumarate hydratase, class II
VWQREPIVDTRLETDTFGPIEVQADRFWAERARRNFRIGAETMPLPVIRALAPIKRVAAQVNCELKLLDERRANAIVSAADEILAGKLDGHFPLAVWQSGSGTQTNMNVNEVIANRGNELLGGARGAREPLHPNDHVNKSQSTNDGFPTAIRIAAAREIMVHLVPALERLHRTLADKAEAFAPIVEIGRTHLQDAVPLTLGQEFSGYAAQLASGIARIRQASAQLFAIAQGGTAVVTGLNAPPALRNCLRRGWPR